MANNKKCSFQKMGTKRVARPKKKNALTPK